MYHYDKDKTTERNMNSTEHNDASTENKDKTTEHNVNPTEQNDTSTEHKDMYHYVQ
jgi:hypothetical protein